MDLRITISGGRDLIANTDRKKPKISTKDGKTKIIGHVKGGSAHVNGGKEDPERT